MLGKCIFLHALLKNVAKKVSKKRKMKYTQTETFCHVILGKNKINSGTARNKIVHKDI